MPIVFFKDRFLPEAECHISIHDRAFRFGDGLFETLLVIAGAPVDFAAHHQRLQDGLAALRIALDTHHLEAQCRELARRNNLRNGYVRIIVSRGENGAGAIGYLPKDARAYYLIQSIEKPYPAFTFLRLWQTSQQAVLRLPSKTNNALIYTLAMLEAQEQDCDNALLLDADGHVCETASGNLFWIKDNILFTPATDLPLVPGTVRKRALECWPDKAVEGRFTLEALCAADEVFMTNIGCIAAAVTELKPLGKYWPVGEQTRALRARLDGALQHSASQNE